MVVEIEKEPESEKRRKNVCGGGDEEWRTVITIINNATSRHKYLIVKNRRGRKEKGDRVDNICSGVSVRHRCQAPRNDAQKKNRRGEGEADPKCAADGWS